MNTQVSISKEENLSVVAITDESEEYFLWQKDESDKGNIYFEYNDQINSGYNTIKECTVMLDGIHIVLTSGELLHFYFNNLPHAKYTELTKALENIYSKQNGKLEIQD